MNFSNRSHFTQVVWKGSKEIGVGKAQGKDGKTIVVASYRPAGNMVGNFRDNVLPPKDGKIILPVQKDSSKPSDSPFSSRFDDARKGFGDSGAKPGTETKSTRTYTVTEGSGPNAVTKTITEETIIKPDGSKVTRRSETTTSGGDSGGAAGFGGFKDRAMGTGSSSPASDKKNKPQKLKDFIDEAVKVHNDYRSKHGVGKVKHAKDLSDYAQKWAEQLAARNAFEHSSCDLKGERLGENICCKWSSSGADYTGREACDQWYSELSKHDFNSEPRALGSGHFTQMVWKDCKEMGIGKAKTSGGKVIVVANYRPAGNVVGHFRENVFPPKK